MYNNSHCGWLAG